MAGERSTACFRTVGVDPERLFFAVVSDPILKRGSLQSQHAVQLRFATLYYGNATYKLADIFRELRQPDGSYLSRADLLAYLATLPHVHFDGLTGRKRRKANRRGGRSRVHVALVNDLPDHCGMVACARVLCVNYRTVRGWVILGLPVAFRGLRAYLVREQLHTWLRETHRLVGEQ